MKRIEQTVKTSFVGIELKDAVLMIPVMDSLQNSICTNTPFTLNGMELSSEVALRMYMLLSDIGFVCSDGSSGIPENVKDGSFQYERD